jgi:CheY-like chemotaxis protein
VVHGADGVSAIERPPGKSPLPFQREVLAPAVTSYATAGDREKAFESGCAGYIEKPITPDTFLAQVEEHLLGCASNGGAP